jgi:hypothetical protein
MDKNDVIEWIPMAAADMNRRGRQWGADDEHGTAAGS